jgi:hypothetical protein
MFAETEIVDYCLSFADEGKKIPFSVSVCSKHTEVFHFRLPFAENKWKLPFSISSVFRLRKQGDMNMETGRHGDMET